MARADISPAADNPFGLYVIVWPLGIQCLLRYKKLCNGTSEVPVNICAGDHICSLYSNAAHQLAEATAFVKEGLHANEQCWYIADDRSIAEVSASLTKHGVDVLASQRRGALHLLSKYESYLRHGYFDAEVMADSLAQRVEHSVANGFAGFRVTGEMTWSLSLGCKGLVNYENRVDAFFPKKSARGLCQYSLTRFPSSILREALLVHPLVLLNGRLYTNPYYDLIPRHTHRPVDTDRIESMLANIRLLPITAGRRS